MLPARKMSQLTELPRAVAAAKEAVTPRETELAAAQKQVADPSRGYSLVVLSVATSLDALAVGLSFSMLKVQVGVPALIIGIVSAVLTAAGMHLGRLVGAGSRLGTRAEIIGGLVLLGIGVNILVEHGVFVVS
jgi:putative Mn2+ efflux pump MntP